MKSIKSVLIVLVLLSSVGGALKIAGGLIGSSKSVFVDALTSIANTLAVVLTLRFFKTGIEPPDGDHHYGHHKLTFGGPISTLMIYSFVAGIVVLDLVESAGVSYRVGYEAPLFAGLAMIPYGLAVHLAKRHEITTYYAGFTSIELLESTASVVSSACGASMSYFIDFAGAIVLTAYLFVELVKRFKDVVMAISDVVPKEVVDKVLEKASQHGLKVHRLRLRRILGDVYQGDMVVKMPSMKSLEEVHRIVDRVEEELKGDGVDISIHVEPLKRHVEKGGSAGDRR